MDVDAHRFRTSPEVVTSFDETPAALKHFSLWVGYYGVALVWMTDLTVAGWLVAIPVQAVIMSAPMALVPDSGTGRSIAFPRR